MTWSRRHVLTCDGRLAPAWDVCAEFWVGGLRQSKAAVWTDAQAQGWARVSGTLKRLCSQCAVDIRSAMTLGPCMRCGKLRLHQGAYNQNPDLRHNRVRANGPGLCMACYCARRRAGMTASLAPSVLSATELLRLRTMVGVYMPDSMEKIPFCHGEVQGE